MIKQMIYSSVGELRRIFTILEEQALVQHWEMEEQDQTVTVEDLSRKQRVMTLKCFMNQMTIHKNNPKIIKLKIKF
jgi:hypothetical protein